MMRTHNEIAARQDMRTVPGDAVLRNRGAKDGPVSVPTQEEIRVRAYEIYVKRGAEPGREAEDWAQAERDLNSRASRPRPK